MAGSETFDRRLEELGDRVGHESLRAAVEVDQAYAQYQHEGLDLRHPRGGQARFLGQPLYDHRDGWLEDAARHVLDGKLVRSLSESMEDLSAYVSELAPVEFADLRGSGHPTVTRGEHVVYDRPPAVARLTPAQLKAKAKARNLTLGDFGASL